MKIGSTYKEVFGTKYNDPKLVVLWCLLRYLPIVDRAALLKGVEQRKRLSDAQLLEHIKSVFELERLRLDPIAKEDIWVYNYVQYEFKGRFVRSKLLGRYQREVFAVHVEELPELLGELKEWLMIGK